MENQEINVEEKKNLIKLKYRVFSQRIHRLYNIFNVISQNNEHEGDLKAIEVIKEQYEKMYNAILERQEFEKYQEVENTMIPKLAKIEHELDRHIYRTSKKCEEILDTYLRKSGRHDNYYNLQGELKNIKGIKELLKLYRPYISQEQEERLKNRISELKYDLVLRIKISKMDSVLMGYDYSILYQCDSKEEIEIFERLTQEKFMGHIKGCLIRGLSKKEKEDRIKKETESIMCFGGVLYGVLKKVIHRGMSEYKKQIDKAYRIIKLLYKIEKENQKSDFPEKLKEFQSIKERFDALYLEIKNKRYDKYLEIRGEIIPFLENVKIMLEDYVKSNPEGIDYILNTVHSKEFNSYALLEENESDFEETLCDLLKLYNPLMVISDDEKLKISEEIKLRKELRTLILQPDSWLLSEYNYICNNIDIEFLMKVPVFDNNVLPFGKLQLHVPGNRRNIDGEQNELAYLKYGYFEELVQNKKFSLIDRDAIKFYEDIFINKSANTSKMDYEQRVIWMLYRHIFQEETFKFYSKYRKEVYYLIELDEETDMYINVDIINRRNYWPIGGKKFYNIPNFQYLKNDSTAKREFKWVGVKTKKVLVKARELVMPTDESRMKKIPREEAEQLIENVIGGDYGSATEEVIEEIFGLWPEREENKEIRTEIKQKIWKELMLIIYDNKEAVKVKCFPLYKAVKDEINRIRETSKNYHNCHNFRKECERISHLMSFIKVFLEFEEGKETEDYTEFSKDVVFEMALKKQIERLLYNENGDYYSTSYFHIGFDFHGEDYLAAWFGIKKYCEDKFHEYIGDESKSNKINLHTNSGANEAILADMARRPEKYKFVLQSPENNPRVPKETREKIAQCASRIELEISEELER